MAWGFGLAYDVCILNALYISCCSWYLYCTMFIAELRNDHKDITNKIEKNLEVLHSTKLSRNEASIPASSGKF